MSTRKLETLVCDGIVQRASLETRLAKDEVACSLPAVVMAPSSSYRLCSTLKCVAVIMSFLHPAEV